MDTCLSYIRFNRQVAKEDFYSADDADYADKENEFDTAVRLKREQIIG